MSTSSLTNAPGYDPSPHLARKQMQEFVETVNNTLVKVPHSGKERETRPLPLSDMQEDLRRLVRRWFESGPNLRVMLSTDAVLSQQFKQVETTFHPTSTGRGYFAWGPITKGSVKTPRQQAFEYFLLLVDNSLWELLSGPCARARCGNYFLRKTKRQKVYCSRTCSSEQTAASTMKKKRAAERDGKIRAAKKSIDQWGEKKRRLSWKKWVAADPGLTIFWLTRAVNSGWIKAPETEEALAKVGRS